MIDEVHWTLHLWRPTTFYLNIFMYGGTSLSLLDPLSLSL